MATPPDPTSSPTDTSTPDAPSPKKSDFGSLLVGGLFWAAVLAYATRDTIIPFVAQWWWAVLIGVVVLTVLLIFRPVRDRLARATFKSRTGLTVFVLIPMLVFAIGGAAMLPLQYRILVARSMFLVVVCLLPATLYYLFIVNRKYSLLNEFLGNLARLGLLTRRGVHPGLGSSVPEQESVAGLRRRVLTYLRKFEAVYGPVAQPLVQQVESGEDLSDLTLDPRWALDGSEERQVLGAPETSVPLLVATVLIILGWVLTLPPWPDPTSLPGRDTVMSVQSWLDVLDPVATPTRFAFLGAYFFSIQLLFRRFLQRDLPAKAYVSVALRVVLAVIGAWVLLQVVTLEPGGSGPTTATMLVLAFVIGAFPPVLWQFVVSAVRKLTKAAVVVPSLEAKMPVTDLDGITVWHQARLEETGIEDISDAATADLVDLLVSTRFPADRVMEWVDQALLYMHVRVDADAAAPSGRALLAEHGIRNATSLVAAYRTSGPRGDRDAFEAILPGEGRKRIVSLIDAVTTHPNFDLLWHWKGLGWA